ncbi:hypothetical protein JHK87_041705 [Glycine soja]|nr:hypothetical protein JHK87_041705 [Glycine soja]
MKTQRIRLGSGSKKHTEIRIWKPVAITTCPLWRSGCAAVITQYYRLPREMILVAIVAEVLEEYTALLARVLEQVFRSAPVPRRVRFLILRALPFASSRPRTILPPPTPSY